MYNTLISVAELQALLTAEKPPLIFDCRYNLFAPTAGQAAWRESRVPGALYLHLDDDLSGPIIPGKTGRHPLPDRTAFAEKMQALGLEKGRQVVAYDDKGGGIAARLWWMLHWIGHPQVAVLDGGWPAWESAGAVAVNPAGTVHPVATASTATFDGDAVDALRMDAAYHLIDSRTAARYRGEQEPIDPVAGHIAGALNFPWPENLGPDGKFKSVEALRERFDALQQQSTQKVFYCGSGVTACHNILAYYRAYGEMPGLYPGSWSDWITRTTG